MFLLRQDRMNNKLMNLGVKWHLNIILSWYLHRSDFWWKKLGTMF